MSNSNRNPGLEIYRPGSSGERSRSPFDDFRKEVRNQQLPLIKDRQRNRRLGLFTLVAAMLFFSLVVLFWTRMENRRLDYEIARLESILLQMEDKTGGLRGDASSARSLELVRSAAIRELGLREPETGQVVHCYVSGGIAAADDLGEN
jgi:hypothetical protein